MLPKNTHVPAHTTNTHSEREPGRPNPTEPTLRRRFNAEVLSVLARLRQLERAGVVVHDAAIGEQPRGHRLAV